MRIRSRRVLAIAIGILSTSALTALPTPAAQAADAFGIKVLTYNVHTSESNKDLGNTPDSKMPVSWDNRANAAAKLAFGQGADVVGLQEVRTYDGVRYDGVSDPRPSDGFFWTRGNTAGYALVPTDKEPTNKGETGVNVAEILKRPKMIFYNPNRLILSHYRVVGFTGTNTTCVEGRSVALAEFILNDGTGRKVLVANTHLASGPECVTPRQNQAAQVQTAIKNFKNTTGIGNAPTILVGDMNVSIGDNETTIPTLDAAQSNPSYNLDPRPNNGNNEGTKNNGWQFAGDTVNRSEDTNRYDWIFASGNLTTVNGSYTIYTSTVPDYTHTPSDHYPVSFKVTVS